MFERAVSRRAGSGQERGHGGLIADSPQCLGGGAAVVHRRAFEQLDESVDGAAVAPEPRRMNRGLPDGFVRIGQKSASHFSCGGIVNASQGPNSVAPEGKRRIACERTTKRGKYELLPFGCCKRFDGEVLDGRARVAEQLDELWREQGRVRACFSRGAGSIPRGSVSRGAPSSTHAIDRPEHVGFLELRGRAAEFVPAAGVDDDQAAVGVFEHVGRVEIEVRAGDEIFVVGCERRAGNVRARAG